MFVQQHLWTHVLVWELWSSKEKVPQKHARMDKSSETYAWSMQVSFTIFRGHYSTPTQTMHYFCGKSLKNYHTFASSLIPPRMGPISWPHCFFGWFRHQGKKMAENLKRRRIFAVFCALPVTQILESTRTKLGLSEKFNILGCPWKWS